MNAGADETIVKFLIQVLCSSNKVWNLNDKELRLVLDGFKMMVPLPGLSKGKDDCATTLRERMYAVGMILAGATIKANDYWAWAKNSVTTVQEYYVTVPTTKMGDARALFSWDLETYFQ